MMQRIRFLTLSRLLGRVAWPGAAPRAEAGERPERMLFAAPAGVELAALRWALTLSAAAGAELHVLRVVPGPARSDVPLTRAHALELTAALAEVSAEARRAQAFCDRAPTGSRVHVRAGRFVDEAAACTRELGAALVVVPAIDVLPGSRIAALCGATGAPVFVARASSAEPTIVAATDLEDEGYPVLRAAAALGRRLEAPVVAVHNVPLHVPFPSAGAPWPMTVLPSEPALADRRRRLARALERAHVGAEGFVMRASVTAEAIVARARDQRADVIVVGNRPRPFRGILCLESVGAQVVDRASQSVLMTPLEGRAAAPSAP